jgi:hypothetical protein
LCIILTSTTACRPEACLSSKRMAVSGPSRANGTYHAAQAQKERQRRTRLLIWIGGLMAALGIVQVALIDADMTRIEQSGPERLALAGGGVAHFVPSILANLPRANAPPSTVSVILADDPRHSPPFVENKRALERWVAIAGLGLALLFMGLESTIPTSTAHQRSPTGTDLSRLLIILSLTYAGLSFFESG